MRLNSEVPVNTLPYIKKPFKSDNNVPLDLNGSLPPGTIYREKDGHIDWKQDMRQPLHNQNRKIINVYKLFVSKYPQ